MLTEKYKADSLKAETRLSNLEGDLNRIESGSEDMKQLDQEFKKQLTDLTSSFNEHKKKELIEDIVQWGTIGLLTVYVVSQVWRNSTPFWLLSGAVL